MPHAIAVAGLRYERVVVLPSSVDVGEDVVRTALERTEAIVFARELETMRAIESLCDARLGLDTAFFHDYGRFVAYAGSGTLNAFRADAEARGHDAAPPGSEDISVTAGLAGRVAARDRERRTGADGSRPRDDRRGDARQAGRVRRLQLPQAPGDRRMVAGRVRCHPDRARPARDPSARDRYPGDRGPGWGAAR